MGHVTELIDDLPRGDHESAKALFSLVYHELRSIASDHMRRESPAHTLQPTALVNEAFLRITSNANVRFNDRRHFFCVASRAMQRILVDQARTRKRIKRGGGISRVPLTDTKYVTSDGDSDLLDLDEALNDLESHDSEQAELVRLHVFSGFTLQHCAEVLNTSKSTVERRWRFVRAWLVSRMS